MSSSPNSATRPAARQARSPRPRIGRPPAGCRDTTAAPGRRTAAGNGAGGVLAAGDDAHRPDHLVQAAERAGPSCLATRRAGPANPGPSRAVQPTATSAQPRAIHASASAFAAGTRTAAPPRRPPTHARQAPRHEAAGSSGPRAAPLTTHPALTWLRSYLGGVPSAVVSRERLPGSRSLIPEPTQKNHNAFSHEKSGQAILRVSAYDYDLGAGERPDERSAR